MEIKLKSVFQSHKLRLAVKALLFAVILAALKSGSLGFWPIVLFFVGSIVIYSAPFFRTLDLITPLLVLCVDALLFMFTLGNNHYSWIFVAYFAALFYIILGIKELAFVGRDNWQRVLALGLVYPMLLMLFYYSQSMSALWLVGVFVVLLALTRGIIGHRLPSWLISLISLELAWASSLLPVGFISQAGIASLSYFILIDISRYYVENRLNKRVLLMHVTLFVLLVLIIFGFSRWGI